MKTETEFLEMLKSSAIAGADAIREMKDSFPCGGAWLNTSGTSQIAKLFKKYGLKDSSGRYVYGDWNMSKGTYRGYSIHHYGREGYQSMNMDIAKYSAIQSELVKFGIGETSLYSYID